MSEDRYDGGDELSFELGWVVRRLRRLLYDLLEWLYSEVVELHLEIVPIGGPPVVSPVPQPFPIDDDQSLPLGLALVGSNPSALTITSAVWSATGTVGVTPATDTLTATATTTAGNDGAGTVAVVATLSDGSTLSDGFAITVGVTPVPLSLQIVPGTPTP